MMKILVINGPNLNMLGKRDATQYSDRTYDELITMIQKHGDEIGAELTFFQSNHEGDIIDCIQDAMSDGTQGLVINAGAYTHYSYAIHDALEMLHFPKVEVHISDINNREAFRKVSVIRDVCTHAVIGEGFEGYLKALDILKEEIK